MGDFGDGDYKKRGWPYTFWNLSHLKDHGVLAFLNHASIQKAKDIIRLGTATSLLQGDISLLRSSSFPRGGPIKDVCGLYPNEHG